MSFLARVSSTVGMLIALGTCLAQVDPKNMSLPKGNYDVSFLSVHFKTPPTREGKKFTRQDNLLSAYYGLSDRLEVGTGVGYRQNHSGQQSSRGLESVGLSLKYQIPLSSALRLYPYLHYKQTLYSREIDGEEIVLGDAGKEMELGGLLGYNTHMRMLTFYLGLRRPPNQLSWEMPSFFDAVFFMNQSFALNFRLRGNFSLKTSDERPKINTGGTSFYNSHNRTDINVYGSVFFFYPNGIVGIGVGKTLHAKSYQKFTVGALFLSYRFDK